MKKRTAWLIVALALLVFATSDWWLPGPSAAEVDRATALDLQDAVVAARADAQAVYGRPYQEEESK